MGESMLRIASAATVAMPREVPPEALPGFPARASSPDAYELAAASDGSAVVSISVAARSPLEEERRADAAMRVARTLLGLAADEKDYEIKMQALGHAGAIFAQFGTPEEIYRVHQLMLAAARKAGREEDVAFYRALEAMGDGDADAVSVELAAIPDAYDGREILTDFVESRRSLDRMVPSFAAAEALAEAAIARMEETEDSLLGRIARTDYSETKALYAAAIDGWRARLESGRFASSREIIEDLWEGDPQARRGLALLAGAFDGVPETAGAALERRWGDHVTLGDILGQEESPDPASFAARLDRIAANADADGMAEVAATASAMGATAAYEPAMAGVIDRNFENRSKPVIVRDFLKGALEPAQVATMIGGFFLARLTTSAAMAKLATKGVGGLSLGARAGSAVIETGIESGAFTFYQRVLSSALTTNRVDWTARGFARDWATLALSFGFLRASNIPLGKLRRRMAGQRFLAAKEAKMVPVGGRLVPALNAGGTAAFAVAENLAQAVAFYAGGRAGYAMHLVDRPASFFEQWLQLLEFQVGVRMANRATRGWVDRTALKLRTEPVTDAISLIARRLTASQPELSSALTQRILSAHVRGRLSLADLAGMRRLFEKRDPLAIDLVLKANAFLDKADIDLVSDGERLFAGGSSVRRRVVERLRAEAREGKKLVGRGDGTSPLIASFPGNTASVRRAVGIGAPDPGVVAVVFHDPELKISSVLHLPADATVAEKAEAIDALLTHFVLREGSKVDSLRSTVATTGRDFSPITDVIALSGGFGFGFAGTEGRFDPRRIACDPATGKLFEAPFDFAKKAREAENMPPPLPAQTEAAEAQERGNGTWTPPLTKKMFELNEITERTPFGEIQNNFMTAIEAKGATLAVMLVGSGSGELRNQIGAWFGSEVSILVRRPSELKASMKEPASDVVGFYDRIVAVDALRIFKKPGEQLAAVGLLADVLAPGGQLLVTISPDPQTAELAALATGDGKVLEILQKAGYDVVATPRIDDTGEVSDVHIVKTGEGSARLDDLLTEAVRKR